MSFDIALSGIQAINEQLDTISNNIANAGTYGFKSSTSNFASLYAGTQPSGVAVGSTSQSMDLAGGVVNTGNALDAAINGAGFFASKDITGQTLFSRVGLFSVNSAGFVVDGNGNRVQGNSITPPSTLPGPLGDLPVPTGQIPAVASTTLNYVGNLSADWTAPAGAWVSPVAATPGVPAVEADPTSYNMTKTSVVYDSLGAQHTLSQYFIATGPGAATVQFVLDGTDLGQPATLTFDATGQISSVNGAPPTGTPPQAPPVALAITPTNGANPIALNVNYTGTTDFAGDAVTATNAANGYASGTYTGLQLGQDGSLIAQYSNGQKQSVGLVAVATFADQDALTPTSDTSWTASASSGTPNYSTPGVGTAGQLTTSSLEQSNVDITAELVSLMGAQNNYQANSKVIQTQDSMLQSLMQAL